jgi:hypothetical protein
MHRPSTPRLRTELKGGANPCCTWQWGGGTHGVPKGRGHTEGGMQGGSAHDHCPTRVSGGGLGR